MDKPYAAVVRAARLDRGRPWLLLTAGLSTLALLAALVQVCEQSVQRGERVRAELRATPSVRSTP